MKMKDGWDTAEAQFSTLVSSQGFLLGPPNVQGDVAG